VPDLTWSNPFPRNEGRSSIIEVATGFWLPQPAKIKSWNTQLFRFSRGTNIIFHSYECKHAGQQTNSRVCVYICAGLWV
jgi:hypothetical protein